MTIGCVLKSQEGQANRTPFNERVPPGVMLAKMVDRCILFTQAAHNTVYLLLSVMKHKKPGQGTYG